MPDPVKFRKSALLEEAGFAHAFFERDGGVSEGVFDSLNFTTITGDTQDNVDRNLELAGDVLDVSGRKIYFLSQVHGTAHLTVNGTEDRNEVVKEEGDVVLTQANHVAAAIRTADCVSVLVGCTKTGWVAACHAGWQGCVRQAVPATIEALKEVGATEFVVAIGPHISLESFEVSDDVAQALVDASPDKDIVDRSYPKPHVNLRKMVRAQLNACGLEDSQIDDVEGCTVVEKESFYSYRRDGNPSGRMLSAIVGKGR